MATASDNKRFMRFLLAGGLNTLFGFTVYSIAILMGAPVWAGLLIANVTGLVFNFVTTGGYAFRTRVISRFPRFAGAYLLIYLINWVLIQGLRTWVSDAIVAQAILTLPMAVLSYLIMAKWVFASTDTTLGTRESSSRP